MPIRLLAAAPTIVFVAALLIVWTGPRFLDSFMFGVPDWVQIIRAWLHVALFCPLVLGVLAIVRPPRRVGGLYPLFVVAVSVLIAGYSAAMVLLGFMFLGL